MKIADERKSIDAALDAYRNALDTIPDELFEVTPPGGGWSYAEVYSHILQATIGSSIALEKSTQSTCKTTNQKPTFFGRLVLWFGVFPPVKTKAPAIVTDKLPANKITKEDARNLLVKCRRRVDIVLPLIHDAQKNSRTAHPRLGMLNAAQWFKFIRIHLQHHLKQLKRNDKAFAK